MKLLYSCIALCILASTAVFAQKTVQINTSTMSVSPAKLKDILSTPSVPLQQYSGVPEYVRPTTMGVTTFEADTFATSNDESDSAFIYTSPIDTTRRLLAAFVDRPVTVNFATQGGGSDPNIISGSVQFIPGRPGPFKLERIRMLLFQLSSAPKARNDFHVFICSPKSNNIVNFNKLTGTGAYTGTYNFPFDSLEILGNQDGYVISKDTVSSRLNGTNLRYTFLDLSNEGIQIPANKSWGILVWNYLDQSHVDSSRLYGVYEWSLPANRTYGGFLRTTSAGVNYITSNSNLSFNSTGIRDTFPIFFQRPLRNNYDMIVLGQYDAPASVETLSEEAAPFTLNTITPNPVSDGTKFTFSLQSNSMVSLRVVNTMGQVVATEIDNANMTPGTYSADFNASSLPGGTYFVTLSNGTQSVTRSMVVIR